MRPSTTGEVSKWKIICVPPLKTVTEFAGVPFTMKTLPSTPPSGALRLTVKSVGGVPTTMLPHGGELLVTEQPAGDGVGVGLGGTVAVGVTVAVRVGVAVGVGLGAAAQYLPPVFKRVKLKVSPPQTIISLPVQTAV